MQGRTAASLGGPQTKLPAELGKTGANGVIGQRVPLLRDKEHVCQSVITENGAQRAIALELGRCGWMQGDQARLVELRLTNVHERWGRLPLHIGSREAESLPDPQPGTGQEADHHRARLGAEGVTRTELLGGLD